MDKNSIPKRGEFTPAFMATGVGSLPHKGTAEACRLIARTVPEIPFWPQLPQHSPFEGMNPQVSPGLPFLVMDETGAGVRFDAGRDPAPELERVYQAYLSGDTNSFALIPAYAGGFEAMLRELEESRPASLKFFKGQIVGPITFGLSIQDEKGKDIVHNELIYDGLIKGLLLRGRWVIERMKKICPRIIFSIDEPALSGYGSAFFSVDGATVLGRLNEAIEEFQKAGAWVGIHCCGNTDWALLFDTKADIINFDAWGYFDRLVLYSGAVKKFLARGGILDWGIVPTSEFTGRETVAGLEEKLEDAIAELARTGIREEQIRERSLLTSSCGMGLMSVADAEKAMTLLSELSARMRKKR
jgi:hypothetical protein